MLAAFRKWTEARLWRWGGFGAALVCGAVYVANLIVGGLRPGSLLGITYGAAALVMLVVVGAWGLRRRTMRFASRRRLGSARTWLYLHLYGGGLFVLLMLMHTAFRLPRGPVTAGLWLLSLWTALSGVFGLLLQRWLPKVLTSGLSMEVNADRIPELVEEVRTKAETLAARCSEPVREVYRRRVAPQLAAPRRRLRFFFDITGGSQNRLRELDYLRTFLPPEETARLDGLSRLLESKLEMDAHFTLQTALRWWLYLHVPTSIVLVLFLVAHLFTVFYY